MTDTDRVWLVCEEPPRLGARNERQPKPPRAVYRPTLDTWVYPVPSDAPAFAEPPDDARLGAPAFYAEPPPGVILIAASALPLLERCYVHVGGRWWRARRVRFTA